MAIINVCAAMTPVRIAIIAGALCCSSVWAQDSSKAVAAEALLEASRVEQMIEQMYAQMPQMMSSLMPQAGPDGPSTEEMQSLMQGAMAFIDERIGYQALKPDYIALYMDTYSEEDLIALTEFMESPLGQRFLDKTPELMTKTSLLVQERMGNAMPELLELMQSEFDAMNTSK
jgi:hypothetical protein